jgi:hypothetical protein
MPGPGGRHRRHRDRAGCWRRGQCATGINAVIEDRRSGSADGCASRRARQRSRLPGLPGARSGIEVAYSTPKTVIEDLKIIQPTIMPSVPSVFEKANVGLSARLEERTGIKGWLGRKGVDWAAARPRGVAAIQAAAATSVATSGGSSPSSIAAAWPSWPEIAASTRSH